MSEDRCFSNPNKYESSSDHTRITKQKTIYKDVVNQVQTQTNFIKSNGVNYNQNFGLHNNCLAFAKSYDLLLDVTKGKYYTTPVEDPNWISNEAWSAGLYSVDYSANNVNVVVDTSYNAGNDNHIIFPITRPAELADISWNGLYPGVRVDPSYNIFYNECDNENYWREKLVDMSFNTTNYYSQSKQQSEKLYGMYYPGNVTFSAGKYYTLSTILIGNIYEFGRSVSISGDGNTLAISSVEEQTVYVYTKNINNSWSLTSTINPGFISFGSSLQLSYDGNTLIVGAYLYPPPNENGKIYIFEKFTVSIWNQTFSYIGTAQMRFGKSVSISNDGSVIAVGSQYDNTTTYNGKIEVFERNGSHWNSAPPTYTLIATGLNFEQLSGEGLFLSGNGNFISATTDANKIYVYKKSGVSWSSGNTSQTLTISSDDNVYFDTNANYLCIGTLSGNIAYVYTYNTTTGLFEPQQLFNNLDGPSSTVIIISPDGKYTAIGMPIVNSNTGVVYIYKIINNTWNLIEKIYGDRINGLFGTSLSFNNDGSTLAIGASSYDAQAGKVYIYFRTL
jgi:hypothetical protein